jgi:hypothetical protein
MKQAGSRKLRLPYLKAATPPKDRSAARSLRYLMLLQIFCDYKNVWKEGSLL